MGLVYFFEIISEQHGILTCAGASNNRHARDAMAVAKNPSGEMEGKWKTLAQRAGLCKTMTGWFSIGLAGRVRLPPCLRYRLQTRPLTRQRCGRRRAAGIPQFIF
jgi:hypothetical protein